MHFCDEQAQERSLIFFEQTANMIIKLTHPRDIHEYCLDQS